MNQHKIKILFLSLITFTVFSSGDAFAKSKKKKSSKPAAAKVEATPATPESLEGIWLLTKKTLNGGKLMKGGKTQFNNKTISYNEEGGMLVLFKKDGTAFIDIVGTTDGIFNDLHKYVKESGYKYTLDKNNVTLVPNQEFDDERVKKMETLKYVGISIKGSVLTSRHDVSFFWPFGAPTISQTFRKLDLNKDEDRGIVMNDRINFRPAIVEFIEDSSSGSETASKDDAAGSNDEVKSVDELTRGDVLRELGFR